MFSIGPSFWGGASGGGGGGPIPVPGPPVPSAITAGFSGLVTCRINDTQALVCYSTTTFTDVFAVVLTVSGFSVSFGTPVSISGSTIEFCVTVRRLNPATNEFVVFGRAYGGYDVCARVIEVSGTVVTTPNPAYATYPGAQPAQVWGEVIAPSQLGVVFASVGGGGDIRGIAATVAAGVVTWGSSVSMATTGAANLRVPQQPPKLNGNRLTLWFDMYDGALYTNLNAVEFSYLSTVTTVGTPWIPATPGDRIKRNPTNGFGAIAQFGFNSADMAMLYQDFGTGAMASVRGEFASGVTGSYNHSDSAPYLVESSPPAPYAPPALTQMFGQDVQSNRAFSAYTVTYISSGAGYIYTCALSGEIVPVANPVQFTSSGLATLGVVRHVHLSATKMLVLYRGAPGNELFAVACNLTA